MGERWIKSALCSTTPKKRTRETRLKSFLARVTWISERRVEALFVLQTKKNKRNKIEKFSCKSNIWISGRRVEGLFVLQTDQICTLPGKDKNKNFSISHILKGRILKTIIHCWLGNNSIFRIFHI